MAFWLLALFCLIATTFPGTSNAVVCSNPGQDGPASVSGIVNTYYIGSGTAPAGSTSLPVSGIDTSSGGSSTPVVAGDLLLVMQMQDADIDSSNSASYGGSSPGTGYTALNNSGVYEYVVAAGPLAGGVIPISSPLIYTYRSAAATGTAGQRSFQVIRTPQYSSATLTGAVNSAPWNGATGGVVAFDVAGQLSWGGQSINVTGRGFRGGGTRNLTGGAGTNTDYRTLSTVNTNGGKGEGIAGTPRYLFIPTTPGPVTNAGGSILNTGVEGYPNGSHARGAPGNAGGGGSDGNPTANDQNTGGGGGGAYSVGGMGGYGWTPGTPPGSMTGGFGGYAVPMSPGRLTMGGGGGGGTTNNSTGTPAGGIASSGAAGGGIVIIRARTITGSGTINANGTNGNSTILNDASGGGGGGGAVLVFASNNGGNVGTLTVNANGGNGGSNTGGGTPHGPGGGGSGGFVALSSVNSATINVNAGQNGTTATSATSTAPYGSTASAGGYQIYSVAPSDLPGASPNALCNPLMTVSKVTGKADTIQGGTTTYTLSVTNQSGYGTATGVSLSDLFPGLPTPFTLASTDSVTLGGGTTRSPVTNPAAGTTSAAWSTFTIPGGGSVSLQFTANVPAGTTVGTYQNPGTVTYDDPTRTAAGQTVTPGGTYQGGGTVPGSNYVAASSTQEDVTVRVPASITKSFSPVSISAGGSTTLSIAITNPNSVPLTNASFVDTYPAGLVNGAAPAAAISGTNCSGTLLASAGGGSLTLSGGFIPASTTCTVTVNVTSATAASYTNTLPAGAFTNSQNVINTAAANATLLARPTITKSFSPTAVATNSNSTLSFVISNPNAAQALTLSNPAFNDSFPAGLVATGGAVTVTGAGCAGFAPAAIAANAASFSLTAGTLPAGGSCTVSFAVRSASQGNYANTASGITTTQTLVAGTPSNTASLGVGVINISKAISPTRIQSGGTATVTLTLTNPTGIAQTSGAFSDILTGMQAVGGAVGGTCTGTTPNTLSAGQTNLFFTGINIPSAGCTVSFAVTSSSAGTQTNSTSGVSTALLAIGPPSNSATLDVTGPPTIAKAFSPATIQQGGSTTLTFTLLNGNSVPLTNASFSDTLSNMQIMTAGPAGGTCSGASGNSFAAGQTSLTFSGLTIPAGGAGCTVTVPVTSSVLSPASGHANTTSGVSSTEAATGSPATAVYLKVAGTPTIAKAFTPATIAQAGTSTITFTLTNPGNVPLTGGTFSDTLTNMQINASGAAGGTCGGAAGNSFTAGQTSLTFSGIAIPAAASCTVTVVVTSSVTGTLANTASGVTTTETPLSGPPSATANLVVLAPPQLAKSFAPGVIQSGGTSNLTFTLSNINSSQALTSVAFTDSLTNMQISATGAAGGTCTGAAGNSFTAGQTSLSFSGLTIPAASSCTVTVVVTSSTISPAGGHPNITSGATSNQTPVAGTPAAAAYLTVLQAPTISKAFSPNSIDTSTGVTTMILTLTNPNPVQLTAGNFSDTFPANLTTTNVAQNYIGAGRGTCVGVIPSGQAAGTYYTSRTFSGIVIPASGSCTIMVDMRSATAGIYTNTTTGITTAQTPTAGPASNSATLSVGRIGISKDFSPAIIAAGGTSDISFSLNNQSGGNRTAITFRDALPAGMTVAAPLTVTNTCGGNVNRYDNLAPLAAGDTGLRLVSGALNDNATCTVTVRVTVATAGTYDNNTTNLSYSGGGTGPNSNVATLVAVDRPTIAKAFTPSAIDVYGSSTLTFTLTNPNTTALSSASFSDLLTGISVATPTIGGTCAGVISTPALAAGATNLSLTVPTLLPGNCTITIPVTSTAAGTYPNTTSGITTTETGATAGAVSNTATLTVSRLPLQVSKTPSLSLTAPGGVVDYVIGYGNPNASTPLQNVVITDTVPTYTTYLSAACGPLPPGITSCAITAPPVGSSSGTITWTLGGTLNAGASGTVTLSVRVQ